MSPSHANFELAQLARQAQFFENCDYYYTASGAFCQATYYDSTPNNQLDAGEWMSGVGAGSFVCSAPLLSFLADWLREKKRLHVDVQPNMHYAWQVRLVDIRYPLEPGEVEAPPVDAYWLMHDYEQHEQALAAGVEAALRYLLTFTYERAAS
jgi:hypothetical protein